MRNTDLIIPHAGEEYPEGAGGDQHGGGHQRGRREGGGEDISKSTLEYEDAFQTYSTVDQVRKMFSDPSAHWVEERRRIKEQAERPTTTSLLEQVDNALIFLLVFLQLPFIFFFLFAVMHSFFN